MPELTAIIKSLGNWFKPAWTLQCSGCGKVRDKKFLIRGPSFSLCRACWDEAFDAMKGQKQNIVAVRGANRAVERCTFCGERAAATGGLATWPDAAICADCLLLCDEILAEQGV